MRTTRGVEVGAALAVLVACAGCTEVLGFGRFSGEGEDASAPMDGQVDLDAGGDADEADEPKAKAPKRRKKKRKKRS